MESEYLPCPFCGSQPEMWNGRGTQAEIACAECGCSRGVQVSDLMTREEFQNTDFSMTTMRFPDEFVERAKKDLVEQWNTRSLRIDPGLESAIG